MKGLLPSFLAACLVLLPAHAANAARAARTAQPATTETFSFAVFAHAFRNATDDAALERAISATDDDSLAFVVANGIKSASEPCSDALYGQRKEVLNSAKNGLVLSIAGSDWIGCRHANGRSAAIERLNRVRELFYSDEMSLGGSRIPLQRQSLTPKFRSYNENARWEIGKVMFATINLPAENNHYLPDAGRNSEFEDRLIANHDWLQRIFQSATRKNFAGIVLFCDGNPLAQAPRGAAAPKRDGFSEVRRKILELASRYPGKVLIMHSGTDSETASPSGIAWHRNLGTLGIGSGWARIAVDPASATVFSESRELPVIGDRQSAPLVRPGR